MDWDEDFPESLWRRRRSLFRDSTFEEFDRMVQEMFRDFASEGGREIIKERTLPDGTTVRQIGPIVYGYSAYTGPDGKTIVREFGNAIPGFRGRDALLPLPEAVQEREPLVDIATDDKTVKVVAELPGVEQKDIDLKCTERSMTISVKTESRKYHKEIGIPVGIDPKSVKASLKNGVLEVTAHRARPRHGDKKAKIEWV